MKPYIGVTGAVFRDEVRYIKSCFERNRIESHAPMLGFLVSYKNLDNEHGCHPDNRRYVTLRDMPLLIEEADGLFRTIHYNTQRKEQLSEEVSRLFAIAQPDGLQLNVVWPPLSETARIRDAYPDVAIILQLSRRAMNGLHAEEIAERAVRYGADYILIDASSGAGHSIDVEQSAAVYKALGGTATIGFAGALTGKNVRAVVKRLEAATGTKEFCIDAESGVRDAVTSRYGDDVMNLHKAGYYIRESAEALR